MDVMRRSLAAFCLSIAAGAASAAGDNDVFDHIISDLQGDRTSFTAAKDLAKIDAAIALFQGAPEEPLTQTKSVQAFQKALAKLGKLATNPTIAPQINL